MDTADAYRLLIAESPVWAMSPVRLEAMAASLASGIKTAAHNRTAPPPPSRSAVIPIFGGITYGPSILTEFFGLSSTSTVMGIRSALADALADRSVDRIFLLIDSPGGSVAGIPELADEILRARSKKPIIAVADTVAGSAAYWLMASATEAVVTPSGEVGSIGVYALHIDQSAALKKAGLRPTFISAGPHKIEGNSLQPLTDEAEAAIQADIDSFYDMFLEGVAQGRLISKIKVKHDFGGGRMLMADKALAAGMVDRVGTFAETLAARQPTSAARRRARATNIGKATPAAPTLEDRRRRQKQFALGNSPTVSLRRRRLQLLSK